VLWRLNFSSALDDALAAQALSSMRSSDSVSASLRPASALHQLREGEDAAQRVVDLVRHAAGQLAHRRHLLRLDEPPGHRVLIRHVAVGEHHPPSPGMGVGGHHETSAPC
jgi:hypothetical protein